MKPVKTDDATFHKKVLQSKTSRVVNFWVPWFRPCRIIAPVLEEVAAEYSGRVNITKLNTDENSTALQFGIMSIPTLLLIKNGEVVDQIVGAVSKQAITDKLNNFAHNTEAILN